MIDVTDNAPVSETSYYKCEKGVCALYGKMHKHFDMLNVTVMPPMKMDGELGKLLEEARAYWKELEEAGTPYWCVHKEREVSHERAYSKPDQYEEGTGDGIHRKHGVMCADCGGYIQEG